MDSGSNGPCSGLRARFGSVVLPANQNTSVAAQGENRTFDVNPREVTETNNNVFRKRALDELPNCRNIIAVLVHNRSASILISCDSCIVRFLFLTNFYVARSSQCPALGIKNLVVYLIVTHEDFAGFPG